MLVRPGALGDTVLTLPIIDSISLRRPGCEIVLLGSTNFEFLMPPHVTVESFDSVRWAWLFSDDPSSLRRQSTNYDLAYVILKNSSAVLKNLETAGVGAIHASSEPEYATSIVKTMSERLSLPLPPRKPYLKCLSGKKNPGLIWLAPGSGARNKNAPINLLQKVCETLKNWGPSDVHITLGEPDLWLLGEQDFVNMTKRLEAKILHNLSLNELIIIMRNSCIYIGNDSGVSHLAAALNVPSIIFFRTTDPLVWGPWAPSENMLIQTINTDFMAENQSFRELQGRVIDFFCERQTHLDHREIA